jgi:hypothetical protein
MLLVPKIMIKRGGLQSQPSKWLSCRSLKTHYEDTGLSRTTTTTTITTISLPYNTFTPLNITMEPIGAISNASYWQYKQNTSFALKWIQQNAKSMVLKSKEAGPKQSSPPTAKGNAGSRRLKSKARKEKRTEAATAEKEKKAAKEEDVAYNLFNAAKQMGFGNLEWPAIERLIEIHSVALFASHEPPITAEQIYRRYKFRV